MGYGITTHMGYEITTHFVNGAHTAFTGNTTSAGAGTEAHAGELHEAEVKRLCDELGCTARPGPIPAPRVHRYDRPFTVYASVDGISMPVAANTATVTITRSTVIEDQQRRTIVLVHTERHDYTLED